MPDFAARRTMMVDTQVRPSDVTKFPIIDAMLSVPREQFVPSGREEAAYMGEHLALGDGRFVMEPRTLAKLLDTLDVAPDELVMIVGCGLGYSAALMSRLAQAVVAVEEASGFAAEAEAALMASGVDNVAVVEGVLTEGAAKHGPYDVILVDGAVEVLPETLTAQLKDGGRIAAIFMSGSLGVARIGHHLDGAITWRDAFNATAAVLPGFAASQEFSL